jgi:hypothetical protein
VPGTPGTEELCNGIDDNCNGQIDEGFFALHTPCTVGKGICENSGSFICSQDGKSLVCDATPGKPGEMELCGNGLDDDCNGEIDEGFEQRSQPCTVGKGACERTGKLVCTDDKLSLECDAEPGTPGPAELCGNGVDDDCDGQVDEGFPMLGLACSVGVGECESDAIYVCSNDRLSVICPAVARQKHDEQCNGLDDDCDGVIDDNMAKEGTACNTGNPGVCGPGKWHCAGASGWVCNPTGVATTEICDHMDNNCNGMVDEGFPVGQPCDGPDTDLCARGTWQCNAQGGVSCVGDTPNTPEVCDHVDNNCDGRIDEGFNFSTDVNNCGDCNIRCTNPHGSISCQNGHCVPGCDWGAQDCNGNPNDGCERTVPTSSQCLAHYNIGSVRGDTGSDHTGTFYGYGDAWLQVYISEDLHYPWDNDLSSRIDLISPPGVDMDLFVTCVDCNHAATGYSVAGPGKPDTVYEYHDDNTGESGHYLEIHVQFVSAGAGSSCDPWSLVVYGDVDLDGHSYMTCN